MDYFTDVYLKRVNKHGTTIQSRVHGKMECDFENKLYKSVNRVELYGGDSKQFGIGILETKKISEKETVDYLLTRIDDVYENGSVFYTKKPFSETLQAWMIVFKEQYQTIGYNRYIVTLLENNIKWIGNDGLIYSSYVHYMGSFDGKVKDLFKINNNVAVGEPTKTLMMICPNNAAIKRDLKINISDETWRVCNYDKISVPGVMYVTLEEDYVQRTELADEEELKQWSITSNQGLELVSTKDNAATIDFYCSYNGALVDQEVQVKCDNPDIQIEKVGYNKYRFDGAAAETVVIATLKNADKVSQSFSLVITEEEENWIAIVGPQQIKVLQTLEYTLSTSLKDYTVEVKSEKGLFAVERVENNKVFIKGINIGQDNILVICEGVTYSTPINIVSPWM